MTCCDVRAKYYEKFGFTPGRAMECAKAEHASDAYLAQLTEGCAIHQVKPDLRLLVDIVWKAATDSTAVPSHEWADKLIEEFISKSVT